MSANQQPLIIVYASATRVELNKIWKYNEKTYGRDHAADYLDFLQPECRISSRGADFLALS